MSLRRKRSSSSPDPASHIKFPQNSTGTEEQSKRNKTINDIDEVGVIAADQAWHVDVTGLFDPSENGIKIICVIEGLRLHYDLLCNTFLVGRHACALARDPANCPVSNATQRIAVKPAVAADGNHFLKLGVLHPMGGGQTSLDSIVVLDRENRRRLLLPFGWGAGRHVMSPAGGKIIIGRLMQALEDGISKLEHETI